jgi:hypothetical protein
MHDGSDGSLKFIFDLMELERPKSIVPCWISSRRTSSIQRILSFGRTAYVDLTRKWRGCWWRGFRHRAATAGIDVKRTCLKAYEPRPIAIDFSELRFKVVTANVYPASSRGLINHCREPQWIFARLPLNDAKALTKAIPVELCSLGRSAAL